MPLLSAPLVVGLLGVVFIIMGLARSARDGNLRHPRTRTWLLVGVIFALVSAYSYSQL